MKKLLAILTCLLLLCASIPLGAVSVSAATYGNLTYEIAAGEVTITDCDESISGSLTIPDTIEGLPVTIIGTDAFCKCSSLTSVVVPNSVTTIGNSAFERCSSLTAVTIPDNVTTIGKRAFYDCGSLASITIGNSVTAIGEYAFYDCESLTAVTIPDSVTAIGKRAFYGCDSLASITIGNSVTAIGEYAFYDCESLTAVTIPDSVTAIGGSAFRSCDSLTSVTIGDSVTTIGDNAFSHCSSLTSVTIPNSVTTIGDSVFSSCNSLISARIGNSVTSIDRSTFGVCSSLTNITVSVTNPYYCDVDGVLFSKDRSTLIVYPEGKSGAYIIPDSVTTIGDNTFSYCDSLTMVTIPDSVTAIGDNTFSYCSSLTSATIPDSVTTIEKRAFHDCTSLTDVYYGGSETDRANIAIGASNDYLLNATWHYNDTPPATGLTYEIVGGEVTITGYTADLPADLVIPDTIEGLPVTAIAKWALDDCSSLTSVTIPDSVTSIGESAFYWCTSLVSVSIGNGVTAIGSNAFSGCESLIGITVSATNSNYCDVDGVLFSKDRSTLITYPAGKSGAYIIPDSVTAIGNSAFSGCDSLTSVTIPDSVTSIGNYAFSGCDALSVVTIGNRVTTIGNSAFMDCKSLTSITIPDSVTSIGEDAFYHCRFLTSVTIGDNVTSIEDGTFEDCDRLTSITLPAGITTIVRSAFYNCLSLTDVYYGGGEADRANITIGASNDYLLNATWHYNYILCDHTYVGAVTTPNNCGNSGVITYTCTACGDTYTETLPPVGAHVYDNGFDADCNSCGDLREVDIPENAPTFVVEDVITYPGKEFTVAVRTLNNSGIVSLKLAVGYDTDVLELVTMAEGDFSGLSFGPMTNNPFIVNWVDAIHPNNTTDGTVVLLTFRVKEGAALGDTAITVTYNQNDVYDYEFNNVAFLVESGTVTVTDCVLGDLNNDGDINNKDLGLLQRYINEWNVTVNPVAADVDGNGSVNNKDLGQLQRYLNGWDVTLG